MSRHLQEQEICRWLGGEHSNAAEEHLAVCARCRSQLDRMNSVLASFHDSVRCRTERQVIARQSDAPLPQTSSTSSGRRIRFAWAAAGVTILTIAGGLSLARHESEHAPSSAAFDDAAILTRVDADLARTIPGPLEPLAAPIDKETR